MISTIYPIYPIYPHDIQCISHVQTASESLASRAFEKVETRTFRASVVAEEPGVVVLSISRSSASGSGCMGKIILPSMEFIVIILGEM